MPKRSVDVFWLLAALAAPLAAASEPLLLPLHEAVDTASELAAADAILAASGERARRQGLDYARGRLLERLGRPAEAAEAYAAALAATPELRPWARHRLAAVEIEQGHPEVAAGLLATLLGTEPPGSLVDVASRRLKEAIRAGGDCRLLTGLAISPSFSAAARQIELARGECLLREGRREEARDVWLSLVGRDSRDEAASEAAERLATLPIWALPAEQARRVAATLLRHRRLDLALELTREGAGAEGRDGAFLLLRARAHVGAGEFPAAVSGFSRAARAARGALRAEALYRQGDALILAGHEPQARTFFVQAANATPPSQWTGAALLEVVRIDWRAERREAALEAYEALRSRRTWTPYTVRAALFLVASELSQGRLGGVSDWLTHARAGGAPEREIEYWQGVYDELRGDPSEAVEHFSSLLRAEPHDLIATAARGRLRGSRLASHAAGAASVLATSDAAESLATAWWLLPERDPRRLAVARRLRASASGDAQLAPFLSLGAVPPEAWPVWRQTRPRPPQVLLALGRWDEVDLATVVAAFPPSQPALALTAAERLAGHGAYAASIGLAELVAGRLGTRLPEEVLGDRIVGALYPLPWRQEVERAAAAYGVDPRWLWAIAREESRFDPERTSSSGTPGLVQIDLATAREVAAEIGRGTVSASELREPAVAFELAAARLAGLFRRFPERPEVALAAYQAGEAEARAWLQRTTGDDPVELYTKIGRRSTRSWLEAVTASWNRYRERLPTVTVPRR